MRWLCRSLPQPLHHSIIAGNNAARGVCHSGFPGPLPGLPYLRQPSVSKAQSQKTVGRLGVTLPPS